jgi:hypothetical protein
MHMSVLSLERAPCRESAALGPQRHVDMMRVRRRQLGKLAHLLECPVHIPASIQTHMIFQALYQHRDPDV